MSVILKITKFYIFNDIKIKYLKIGMAYKKIILTYTIRSILL
jgi:hypothetical protein